MATTWSVPATIVRVVDGDTLLVDLDLGWRLTLRNYVRLLGINAPEQVTDAGKAATTFVQSLAGPGDRVQVVSHRLLGQTDNHGRALAAITLASGVDLSTAVLDAGHAVPWEPK